MPVTDKRKLAVMYTVLFGWVELIFLYESRNDFGRPLFWLGLTVFSLLGAFALLAGGRLIAKIGQVSIGASFVGLYLLSSIYPDAVVFGIAGLGGLFLGM